MALSTNKAQNRHWNSLKKSVYYLFYLSYVFIIECDIMSEYILKLNVILIIFNNNIN